MRGVQKEYAGRIDVVRVNVLDEKNEGVMAEFGFNTTPEFYLLNSTGRIVAFWDGPVEPDALAPRSTPRSASRHLMSPSIICAMLLSHVS